LFFLVLVLASLPYFPNPASWLAGSTFQHLSVLGSTGSIGSQTLEVVAAHPERLKIEGLAAGNNMVLLFQQIKRFTPSYVSVPTLAKQQELLALLKTEPIELPPTVVVGEEGLNTLATLPNVQTVVVGLVGLLGLKPSMAALKAGKTLATANKETLVAGANLLKPYLAQVRPMDSEHSALFQSLQGNGVQAVKALWLTASGGAFRNKTREELEHVTLEQALKHPNWQMGAKVTIDSATLMNKGLEVIEAHTLFGLPAEQIKVTLHPQSLMHSAVEYTDGSLMAQLSHPDMRQPIQYALSYPQRWPAQYERPALPPEPTSFGQLDFKAPCLETFECLALAYEALHHGAGACIVLNAANEVAVEAFLNQQLRFLHIAERVKAALQGYYQQSQWANETFTTIAAIEALDAWTRSLY
jgi:1-deoxy-D-xylulose-5-phosphate reductoisomerase